MLAFSGLAIQFFVLIYKTAAPVLIAVARIAGPTIAVGVTLPYSVRKAMILTGINCREDIFRIRKSHISLLAAEVQTDTGDSSEDDYMAHMEQENGRIQVDESGIIGVQMDLPPQEISTVNENVQLMDFETVCRKFKENIGNRVYSASGATAHLEITNIYLTSMYVLNKGNSGEYLTVPVWDFCGYIYDEETPENAVYSMKQKDEENAYKVSYLTLNGIDGSVISRYNGY